MIQEIREKSLRPREVGDPLEEEASDEVSDMAATNVGIHSMIFLLTETRKKSFFFYPLFRVNEGVLMRGQHCPADLDRLRKIVARTPIVIDLIDI